MRAIRYRNSDVQRLMSANSQIESRSEIAQINTGSVGGNEARAGTLAAEGGEPRVEGKVGPHEDSGVLATGQKPQKMGRRPVRECH